MVVHVSFLLPPLGLPVCFYLGKQRGTRMCVHIGLLVRLLKTTNRSRFKMRGTSQTGFILCYTVLRVNAVHSWHCWGSCPQVHVC